MEPVKSIIYISKCTRPITQPLLASILASSRRNNAKSGITGFLVCRHGHFLQLLEGPAREVDLLLEKIKADPRHRQIQLLGECQSSERLTPEWKMGLISAESNPDTTEQILSLFRIGNAGETYQSPEALRALLRLFSKGAHPLAPSQAAD
jgi:hypothetical protein